MPDTPDWMDPDHEKTRTPGIVRPSSKEETSGEGNDPVQGAGETSAPEVPAAIVATPGADSSDPDFQAGYRGDEAPDDPKRQLAWAKGVWQRQAKQEADRHLAKREEWVRDMRAKKIKVPDAAEFEKTRAERAAAYQAFYEREVIPLRQEEELRQKEERAARAADNPKEKP